MSEIQIQSASDRMLPGETVRIPVVVVLDRTTKVRGVHATFHGAEETKATYSTYNAATQSTQTHTAVEHVDIVKDEQLLLGNERKGLISNVADGLATLVGGGTHVVLEPGEYPFEVDVQIPADGRPSFKGERCRVFYELSVIVDIPAARDLKALQSFQVVSPSTDELPEPTAVRTRYPEDQAMGTLDSWLLPDIKVEAALRQDTFCEGDTIEGIFQVEAQKSLAYNEICVRLITRESSKAHGHTDGHTHVGPPVQIESNGVIDGQYSQRFNIKATCPGPRAARGQLFSVEMFLQVELDVPWAKDPKIRVPICVLPSARD